MKHYPITLQISMRCDTHSETNLHHKKKINLKCDLAPLEVYDRLNEISFEKFVIWAFL